MRSCSDLLLMNNHRQSGKTTVCGGLAAHKALYKPNSLTLLFAPSLRQAVELYRRSVDILRAVAPEMDKPGYLKATMAELPNHSRIVSLPASERTIRGFSNPDLVVFDESSRIADPLKHSVSAMLLRGAGRMVAPSTPFGKIGWWYEEWKDTFTDPTKISPGFQTSTKTIEKDGDAYRVEAIQVSIDASPFIKPGYIEHERREMPELWFKQEYYCEFLDSINQLIPSAMIDAAFERGKTLRPLFSAADTPIVHSVLSNDLKPLFAR